MSKKYIFKYNGSKESFLTILDSFHTNNSRFYYFDDYIIEVLDDEIRFGVERAGHSGGNWFVSKFTEENNQIEFRGTIQYIGPENSNMRTKAQKILDKIGLFLLTILLFPISAIFFTFSVAPSTPQCCLSKHRRQYLPESFPECLRCSGRHLPWLS